MKFIPDDKVFIKSKVILKFNPSHKNIIFSISSVYSLLENRSYYYTLLSDDFKVRQLGYYYEDELELVTEFSRSIYL